MRVMLRLIKLVRPLTWAMVLAIACGVLGTICAIAIPAVAACALVYLTEGQAVTALFVVCAFCGMLRGALRYGEQICNHYLAFKLLALIRQRVFEALRRLCPAKLECKERGELVALITSDVELLEVFYAHTVSPVVIAVIVSCSISICLAAFHPVLGVVAACGYLCVGALFPLVAARMVKKDSVALRASSAQFTAFWLDSLRGLTELLQFGCSAGRQNLIGSKTNAMEAVRSKLVVREGAIAGAAGFFVVLFSLVELAAAFALYQDGALGASGLVIPFVTILSSFGPTLALANLSGGLPATLAAGQRVLALLDENPETPDRETGLTPAFTGAESKNLSFAYGEAAVLQNFSARIDPGAITGIMGKSGSGKSTFLRLLMRFWQAPKNTLYISKEPIEHIKTAHLRTLQAFMTQDTDILRGTIAENIAVGRLGASREEIIAAAKKASLHEFVETLPHGYDTQAGELGSALSGGERQRIGLARAFLSNAPLLLLDEPTSNLDVLNEGAILQALRTECEDGKRTAVLVSHRASTMGIADVVIKVQHD